MVKAKLEASRVIEAGNHANPNWQWRCNVGKCYWVPQWITLNHASASVLGTVQAALAEADSSSREALLQVKLSHGTLISLEILKKPREHLKQAFPRNFSTTATSAPQKLKPSQKPKPIITLETLRTLREHVNQASSSFRLQNKAATKNLKSQHSTLPNAFYRHVKLKRLYSPAIVNRVH